MPKRRSIFLGYLLTTLTGEIFGFIWAQLMMSDINRMTGRKTIPAASISISMTLGYVGSAVCIALDDLESLTWSSLVWIEVVGNVLLLVTFSSYVLSVVLVYRNILVLSGKPYKAWSGIFAAIGSLLGFLFLPYAQHLLNRMNNKLTIPDDHKADEDRRRSATLYLIHQYFDSTDFVKR